jgi:hypothetical protein
MPKVDGVTITREQLRYEELVARKSDALTGLITRDRSGNKLSDRIDPQTGFCTGVTGPMLVPDGVKIIESKGVSGGGLTLPTRNGNLWVSGRGESKRVIRTTDMDDDAPLPTLARTVRPSSATKAERRASAASKVKKAPAKGVDHRKPKGDSKSDGRRLGPSDAEIISYLKAFCGYAGDITPAVRKAARVAMAHRAQVAEYTNGNK